MFAPVKIPIKIENEDCKLQLLDYGGIPYINLQTKNFSLNFLNGISSISISCHLRDTSTVRELANTLLKLADEEDEFQNSPLIGTI
jgi:hypothetical protein